MRSSYNLRECINVFIAQFGAHSFVAQERRIAEDDIGFRPCGFNRFALLIEGQDRVHLFDGFDRLQDRLAGHAEAVVAQPLNVTDPDGDLREFVRVFVDLDAVQLLRRRRKARLRQHARETQLGHEVGHFFPQIEQKSQRDIQEVAAAASRIEHLHECEFGGEADQEIA